MPFGTNVASVYRVSPRVRWYKEPLVAGFEIECTRASYGTLTSCGDVFGKCPVANIRFILSLAYVF